MNPITVLIATVVTAVTLYFLFTDAKKKWPADMRRFLLPGLLGFCLIIVARVLINTYFPDESTSAQFGGLLGTGMSAAYLGLTGVFNSAPKN